MTSTINSHINKCLCISERGGEREGEVVQERERERVKRETYNYCKIAMAAAHNFFECLHVPLLAVYPAF